MLNIIAMWMILPIGVIILGGIIVRWISLPDRLMAIMFFFASGVLIAALCTEVVPEAMLRHQPLSFVGGFTGGVLLMLIVRSLFEPTQEKIETLNGRITIASVVNIGISLMLNGVLVGIAFQSSGASGILMTVTLTIKGVLIGSGLAQTLFQRGSSLLFVLCVLTAFSAIAFGGSVLGWFLITTDARIITALICAAAAGIMLWVVFEELMIEAHQRGANRMDSMSFFIGCGLAVWLSMVLSDAAGA